MFTISDGTSNETLWHVEIVNMRSESLEGISHLDSIDLARLLIIHDAKSPSCACIDASRFLPSIIEQVRTARTLLGNIEFVVVVNPASRASVDKLPLTLRLLGDR